MILADTSIWVDHLRRGNPGLGERLLTESVACHPFVIGELACGSIRNRDEVLHLLGELPSVPVAGHEEALAFLDAHRLAGTGLGYVDLHLLAAAVLGRTPLWTLDSRLAAAAARLGIAA